MPVWGPQSDASSRLLDQMHRFRVFVKDVSRNATGRSDSPPIWPAAEGSGNSLSGPATFRDVKSAERRSVSPIRTQLASALPARRYPAAAPFQLTGPLLPAFHRNPLPGRQSAWELPVARQTILCASRRVLAVDTVREQVSEYGKAITPLADDARRARIAASRDR